MKQKRRLLAIIMAAAMCTTSLAPVYADSGNVEKADAVSSNTSVNDNLTLEASNSIGNYLKNKQEGQNKEEKQQNTQFTVNQLSLSEENGIIQVLSTQETECTLQVTIYTDSDEKKKITEYTRTVCAGKEVYTEIKADMNILPQYYTVEAVLIGMLGTEMSEVCGDLSHTENTYIFKHADVSDFEEERVLNLDESQDTNFIVLSDETVYAHSDENRNILVSADYENGIYEFENADENITGLKEGDFFCIKPNDADIIAINVESVQTNEGKTTVKESGKEIDKMFSFIKIEARSGMRPAVANAVSTSSDGTDADSEFEKIKKNLSGDIPTLDATLSIDSSGKMSLKSGSIKVDDKGGFNYTSGDVSVSGKSTEAPTTSAAAATSDTSTTSATSTTSKTAVTDTCQLGIKSVLNYNIDFYERFDSKAIKTGFVAVGSNIHFEINTTITAQVSAAISKKDIKILPEDLKLATPVPGLLFSWNPTLDISAEGTVTAVIESSASLDIKLDSNDNTYIKPEFSPLKVLKCDLQVKISVSLNVLPGITFITEKFGKVVPFFAPTIIITAKTSSQKDALCLVYGRTEIKEEGKSGKVFIIDDTTSDVHHMCQHYCIAMTASLTFTIGFDFELLGLKFSPRITPTNWKLSADMYLSDAGFGVCELCPNNAYKVEFVVTKNGEAVPDATVEVDGLTQITDSNGKVIFYCKELIPNNYTVKASLPADEKGKKYSDTKYFTVYKDAERVEIPFCFSSDSESTQTQPPAEVVTAGIPQTTPQTFPEEKQVYEEGDINKFPEVLAFGQLADDIYYSIVKGSDGYGDMSIWGHGYMEGEIYESNINFSSSDNIMKKMQESKVRNVSVYNDIYIDTEKIGTDKNGEDIYIIKDIKEEPILSIGRRLFIGDPLTTKGESRNIYLESISIPNTIEKIDDYAFGYEYQNGALKTLCSSVNLSKIEVRTLDKSESVKKNQVIYNYGGFETANIKEIGEGAFYKCSKISDLKFPETLETIGENAFYGCDFTSLYIPDSVSYIGSIAFADNKNLKKARISSQIKKCHLPDDGSNQIFAGVFNGCENLTELETPNLDLMRSGSYEGLKMLFEGQSSKDINIKKLTITGSPSKISGRLCSDMKSLETVYIPESVTEIGEYAFSGCSSLKTITLPENLETIGKEAFSYSDLSKGIKLPKNVTSISKYAFGESSLSSITFNDSLKVIESSAFEKCKNLKSVSIPDSVTFLSSGAFSDCSSLEEITVGTGITKVTDDNLSRAFAGCTNVKKIRVPALSSTFGQSLISNILNYRNGKAPVTSAVINGTPSSIPYTFCYDAVNMEELYIPTSVTKVEAYAFENITKLQTVYYDGTEEELETLISGIEKGNQPLLDALKHRVMYGDLNEDGVSDLTDLSILSVYLLSHSEYAGKINVKAADIDGNGIVDIADLARLKQHISKDSNVKYPYKNDPRNKK